MSLSYRYVYDLCYSIICCFKQALFSVSLLDIFVYHLLAILLAINNDTSYVACNEVQSVWVWLVFDLHDDNIVLTEMKYVVISLQSLQPPSLLSLHKQTCSSRTPPPSPRQNSLSLAVYTCHMLPGAAPVSRAPDNQRVIEIIVVSYL